MCQTLGSIFELTYVYVPEPVQDPHGTPWKELPRENFGRVHADSPEEAFAVVESRGSPQPVVVPMKHIKKCGDEFLRSGSEVERRLGRNHCFCASRQTATGAIAVTMFNALAVETSCPWSKSNGWSAARADGRLSRSFLAISLPVCPEILSN